MRFILEIDCANAAFDDEGLAFETARLLRLAADEVDTCSPGICHYLRDINGNTVANFSFTSEMGD